MKGLQSPSGAFMQFGSILGPDAVSGSLGDSDGQECLQACQAGSSTATISAEGRSGICVLCIGDTGLL